MDHKDIVCFNRGVLESTSAEVISLTNRECSADDLARRILKMARDQLFVSLRYLDLALSHLELMPWEKDAFGTNGIVLHYSVPYVFETLKENREKLMGSYLHLILHCVFSHHCIGQRVERASWDLACDLAIERILIDLDLPIIRGESWAEKRLILQKIESRVPRMTAETIYRYLLDHSLDPEVETGLKKLFFCDDHSPWYGSEIKAKNLGQEKLAEKAERLRIDEQLVMSQNEWKDIRVHIQTNLETESKDWRGAAGLLLMHLDMANREKIDYRQFLRKFAEMSEVVRLDPEEFDYSFYTYGLRLYGNLPLIEHLEYKEEKLIKEFVIAIDTSGSTMGSLVQAFLGETYRILTTTESFHKKINIRVIQCDSAIRSDDQLTSPDEFKSYIEDFRMRGGGGTDFRPVFKHVDKLLKEGVLTNLKGLVYFTDGFGTFPTKPPVYETAFIFLDSYESPDQVIKNWVPPWAIQVVIGEDQIKEFGGA